MKATKTQVCNKYIEEADRVICLMNALKTYCNQVITEEEVAECGGYRGDGANDPDNRPTHRMPQAKANTTLQNLLIPTEKQANQNDFLCFEQSVSGLLNQILEDVDCINFPEEMFGNQAGTQQPHLQNRPTCQCRSFEPKCIQFESFEDLFRYLISR